MSLYTWCRDTDTHTHCSECWMMIKYWEEQGLKAGQIRVHYYAWVRERALLCPLVSTWTNAHLMLYVGMDSLQHPLTRVLIRQIRINLKSTNTDTILTSLLFPFKFAHTDASLCCCHFIVQTNCNKLFFFLFGVNRWTFLKSLITLCPCLENQYALFTYEQIVHCCDVLILLLKHTFDWPN